MNRKRVPPFQKFLHLLKIRGVEDVSGFQPAFPADSDSKIGILRSLCVAGIWVDSDFKPSLFGIFA